MRNPYKRRVNLLPFVVLIFGIYFLNFGLKYFVVPEVFTKFNEWIIAFGGVLLIVLGIRDLLFRSRRYPMQTGFSR